MTRPNFFLIGFPKCGTTAIAKSLSDHPDVYLSPIKEPHYFAADFANRKKNKIETVQKYEELFSDVQAEKAIGEASTGYVFSDVALDAIERYCDRPKYIIVVRNPVDMVQSEHAQMLRSGHEDVDSLRDAWTLSESRMQGENVPRRVNHRILVSYKEFGRVYKYIGKVFDFVDSGRVHVVIYDDLVSNPRGEYRKIIDFLDLEDDGRSFNERVNVRRFPRSKIIAKFVDAPPAFLMRWHNRWKRSLGVKRLGFIKWLRQKNLRKQRRELDRSLRMEIRGHFSAEVESLESLLGRRLDW